MSRINKPTRYLLLLVLALLLSVQGIAGAQDRPTITIFRGGVTIDYDNDPIITELENRLDVNIEFLTSDWGEIGQVRNLALAAEEDVDIYHHMDLSPQWREDEFILPIDPYISQETHPYLYSIAVSPLFEAMRVDGQTFYVPMVAHGWDWVLAVRQDWMDELGLDMPTNEVEFRELLQAFKDRDPDGRTVGWQIEGSAQVRRSILPILTAFGVPTSFYDVDANFVIGEDGILQPVATHPNTRAALEYLNGLYNDGLINTDFPSMNSFPLLNETYLQAGKAGVGWVQNPANYQMAEENVEWAFIPPFSAEGYEHTRALGIANNGWISIAATADDPQKAVDVLEYLNSEEGRKLIVAGVEGVHYTTFDEDGNFDRNEEAWSAAYDGQIFPLYFYLGQGLMHSYVPVDEYSDFAEALNHLTIFEPQPNPTGLREVISESARWAGEPNPFQFVEFPELNDINVAVNDAIVTGWTKLIAADPGTFDQEWEAFLEEWERVDGPEWVAAFQEVYENSGS